jgi:hypothetical protein
MMISMILTIRIRDQVTTLHYYETLLHLPSSTLQVGRPPSPLRHLEGKKLKPRKMPLSSLETLMLSAWIPISTLNPLLELVSSAEQEGRTFSPFLLHQATELGLSRRL